MVGDEVGGCKIQQEEMVAEKKKGHVLIVV